MKYFLGLIKSAYHMKSVKNIIYMLSVQLVNYAFPLITIPIVARAFGPEKIGVINYIAAIVAYFVLIVNYGFNYTGVRRFTRNKDKKNEIFSVIFFCQFILFFTCSIFFIFFIFFINDFKDNFWLSILTFSACASALFTQNWFLQANNDFKFLAKISFLSKLISFILILFFIKNSSDVIFYVAIVNVVGLFVSITVFFITIYKYKISMFVPNLTDCFLYLKDDRYIFFSSIITSLYTTTGIVLLGSLGSKIDVGYYTSAQKLIDVCRAVVLIPISQVIFPILSEKFGKDISSGISVVVKIMPVFFFISASCLLFLNVFSFLIVKIIFGEGFEPVAPLLSILSFGLFFVFYGVMIGGQIMLNLGMDKAFLNIQVFVSIFSLVINAALIPHWGAEVTAVVWSLSEMVITIYQILYLRKKGFVIISFGVINPFNIIKSVKYVLKKDS